MTEFSVDTYDPATGQEVTTRFASFPEASLEFMRLSTVADSSISVSMRRVRKATPADRACTYCSHPVSGHDGMIGCPEKVGVFDCSCPHLKGR